VPFPFEKVGRIPLIRSRMSIAAICLIGAATILPDGALRNTAKAPLYIISTTCAFGETRIQSLEMRLQLLLLIQRMLVRAAVDMMSEWMRQ
jgi:hypothetical protein